MASGTASRSASTEPRSSRSVIFYPTRESSSLGHRHLVRPAAVERGLADTRRPRHAFQVHPRIACSRPFLEEHARQHLGHVAAHYRRSSGTRAAFLFSPERLRSIDAPLPGFC